MQPSVNATPQSIDKKNLIYWILTLGLPLLIMFIPTSETFTAQMRLFLAITLCGILFFAFEILPQMIPAIMLPVAYVLTGIAPAPAIFGPWSTYIPWMMISGILLANCLEEIGLLKRIAYWSIIRTGGTYNGILYGVLLAGVILNLLIPGQAVIPLAAFTYGICMALNLGKSKESAGIMLTGAFAALLPTLFLYHPGFAVITGAAAPVINVPMTYFKYLFHNWPNFLWMIFMVFLATKLFQPSKPIDVKDYIAEQYRQLGPMSTAEKKGAFVTLFLMTFMMTGSLHGIEIPWGFVIAGCMLYFPGINIGTEKDIKRVPFPFVFFITACMAIGSVANVLGLGKLLADSVLPYMEGSSSFVVIGLVWLLCVVANFLMTPLAIMASFSAPLAQIALSLGIDPLPFFYTIAQGCDQIIFPYEYALYLIFVSFGLIHLRDFIKIFSIKMALNIVFLLAILVPYWKIIGLL
ncbi:MAG: SLC13 family permease [Peptococcales bacterium]|jgi:sodium-dependent dicarboxylate transporter 2/3/5